VQIIVDISAANIVVVEKTKLAPIAFCANPGNSNPDYVYDFQRYLSKIDLN